MCSIIPDGENVIQQTGFHLIEQRRTFHDSCYVRKPKKPPTEIGVAWISKMEVSREQWRLLRLDGVIESSKNVESHNKGNGTRDR